MNGGRVREEEGSARAHGGGSNSRRYATASTHPLPALRRAVRCGRHALGTSPMAPSRRAATMRPSIQERTDHEPEPDRHRHDLTRRFGEGDAAVDALRGVSVAFPQGGYTAIMGPSGSGQVDAHAHPRGPRQADLGTVDGRGHRDHRPRRQASSPSCAATSSASSSSSSTCCPVLTARGERHAAAAHRRPRRRPRSGSTQLHRHGRARRPAHAPARPSSPAASSSASRWPGR